MVKNKDLTTANLEVPSQNLHRKNRWKLWTAISGLAIISATLGGLGAIYMGTTPFHKTNLTPEQAKFFQSDRIAGNIFQLNSPVNILVMGMSVLPENARERGYFHQLNSFDGLADVMLLIRFDPTTDKITMISIPRDTRVEIDGRGIQKINASNVYGGAFLAATTTSQLLGGTPIHGYIRINVLGVGKLIDTLGGVTVDVPYDMKYQDHSQHLYIDLKAGRQHLDGDKALQMLRFRHDGKGDIGRIQRQQILMQALAEQVLNPITLAKSPKILSVIQENIDSNLSVEQLLTLVNFAVQSDRSQMKMLTLPGRASYPREFNTSYWLPNQLEIDQLVRENNLRD